ncbi:hypothetical protein BDR04DRAFT_1131021 [Suillus decipiens]|nr:hypothetical protein BDR04DRAFT_1131021 [Suillus decipiens]
MPPGTYHKTKDKCLQNIYKAKTVRDLCEMVRRLMSNNTHENTAKCACHACIENRLTGCKNPNKSCGSGIWIGDNHQLNKAIKVPGTSHSNQIGELSAVLVALQLADILTPLKIVTDSKYVINGLTTHLTNWEDIGWIGIANTTLFKARPAPTIFQWTKGHDGQLGNKRVDQLAKPDNIDTYIPRNFDIQGTKLTKISQKLAYMEIMSRTNLTHKRATLALLDVTRFAETNETIWHSCRNTDISKNIQLFLYKVLNNAYHVGEFWETIPNYEHRALCTQCPGEIESITHILTDCNNLATWPMKHGTWPRPHIGLILGCGTISIPSTEQNKTTNEKNAPFKKGASRLLRILISESAYLIWTIRCERVIRESTHNKDSVRRRWRNAIDRRLQLDRALASKTRQNTKMITKVRSTWTEVLLNQQPHDDWVTNLEVLVGITLPRPSQTVATR